MTFSTLQFELDDGLAIVTITRPEKLNALNAAVMTELEEVADRLRTDAAVRGMVLTGSGDRAFVAGADIAELAALDGTSGEALARRGQDVFRRLETAGKPLIAAVNGFALGGGCELAMACHVRYAAPEARFGQPEVKLGLIPGYGGTVRLPRLIGRGLALELLLSGNMIDAAEAHRIGLVNRIVPRPELVTEAATWVRTVLAQGPSAVATCLETVDRSLDLPVTEAFRIEAEAFGRCAAGEEKVEGTAAFLEKRSPRFSTSF